METNLEKFGNGIDDTFRAAKTMKEILDAIELVLDLVGLAANAVRASKADAATIGQIVGAIKQGLTIVSKLGGPFTALAPPLKVLLKRVEDFAEEAGTKAEDIVNSTGGVFDPKTGEINQWKLTKEALEELGIDAVKAAVGEVAAQLDSIRAGANDLAQTVREVELPAKAQAAINNGQYEIRPGANLIEALEPQVEAILNLQTAIDNAINSVKRAAQPFVAAADKFAEILSKLDFLKVPLAILNEALKPIRWALDAAEFIFDKVISPVIDPIIEAFKLDVLIDKLIEQLGLPALALFTDLRDKLIEFRNFISGELEDFTTRIDAFTDDILDNIYLQGLENQSGGAGSDLLIGDDDNPGAQPPAGFDGEDPIDRQSNTLIGNELHDLLAGGLGTDFLFGGPGNDVLIGGAGNDYIDGGVGAPTDVDTAVLLGNFSEFTFSSLENGDVVVAQQNFTTGDNVDQGSDTIRNVTWVSFLDQTIAFRDFQRFMYSSPDTNPPYTVEGTPVADFIFGGDFNGTPAGPINDVLRGNDGDDFINGGDGDDILEGGNGNDWLEGGFGNNSINGGRGTDTVSYTFADSFGTVFVSLTPQSEEDPFAGVTVFSDAIVEYPVAVENLFGGNTYDTFWGNEGRNLLSGGALSDKLIGRGGNDVLEGGDDLDLLVGGSGNDIIRGGLGYDIHVAGAGFDKYYDEDNYGYIWYGSAGRVPLWSPYGDTPLGPRELYTSLRFLGVEPEDYAEQIPARIVLDMGKGKVSKYDSNGVRTGVDLILDNMYVIGSQGDDLMVGSAGGDALEGGDGNDELRGGGSGGDVDYLWGGAGNDTLRSIGDAVLQGGEGDDTIFVSSTGNLEVLGQNDDDTIDFSGSGKIWRAVDVPNNINGTQRVVVYHGFGSEEEFLALPEDRNPQIVTVATTEITIGGSGNDDLKSGSQDGNILYGGRGDDDLQALANTDTTLGDILYGEGDNDRLTGGIGSDSLFGGSGNDLLDEGVLSANPDLLDGGDDDDIFILRNINGGQVIGGEGSDTIVLSYTQGMVASLLSGFVGTGNNATQISGIENIEGSGNDDGFFGDGNSNALRGMAGDDQIFGLGGDDLIYGNAGDDEIDGGEGNDLIFGGLGNNALVGSAGSDTASFDTFQSGDRPQIFRTQGAEYAFSETRGAVQADLLGGQANFTLLAATGRVDDDAPVGSLHKSTLDGFENLIGTAGDDSLRGDAADNVLSGGNEAGSDILEGRGGDDILSGGDGNDFLYGDFEAGAGIDMAYMNRGEAQSHHLRSDGGFSAMPSGSFTLEIAFQTYGTTTPDQHDIIFASYAVGSTGGSDNEILLYALPDVGGGVSVRVNNVNVDSTISTAEVADGAFHRLSLSVDTLAGTVSFYLDGELRSTVANAAAASPVNNGGVFVFGQEQDIVGGGFQPDIQRFEGGMGDIRLFDGARDAADIADAWDRPLDDPASEPGLVANWQASAVNGTFSDAKGGQGLLLEGGLLASDIRSGGLAGDDTLDGGDGNDMLNGGAGIDRMAGGAGNDVYVVSDIGDQVIEQEGEGYDIVHSSLISTTLAANVERLIFTTDDNHVGRGNDLDNRINGNAGNDKFVIDGGGADIFSGGSGMDVFDARSSDTGVRIYLQDQSLNGGAAAGDLFASIETFVGSATAGDIMRASASFGARFQGEGGDDRLYGSNRNDYLRGDAGNDDLRGGNGADVLIGGTGDDDLYGGKQADQFRFIDADFGADTIHDWEDGTDRLRFAPGVADTLSDFTIANNGTASVTLTLNASPISQITLTNGTGTPFTIDAADMIFG